MDDERRPPRRASLWLDLGLALLVIWLPLVVGPRVSDARSYDSPGMLAYGMIAVAGFLALIHDLVRRAGEPLRRLGWRPIRPWRELLWTALLWVAAWMTTYAHLRMWPPPPEPQRIDYLGAPTFLNVAYLLVAAVFEESFYRGLLWDRIRRLSKSRALTVVSTSVLFAAAHPYDLRELFGIFLFGLLFGLVRQQGRSLFRLVVAHWAYNLSLFLT
jgi:membrane protease YdiL (CAAX protease family)